MKTTLINFTKDARELLLFTKATRLHMSPDNFHKIFELSEEEKNKELEYMANTIPSSWEFVDYTFLVEGVSRAYTHQQVRTRAASYAQQSMRVVDMCSNYNEFDFVYPMMLRPVHKTQIDNLLLHIKNTYKALLELGMPIEDARSILPTNIATNIVCKFNLRTFSDLVKSRTGGRTQEEYQWVINSMVDNVLEVHPWADKFLFDRPRDYFNEIEEFAKAEFSDLKKRGELLKIVDQMRKSK